MNIAQYAKAIVAVVSAGLVVVQTEIPISDLAHRWVSVSIAVVTAIAVYAIPNAPATLPDPRRLATITPGGHLGAS